MAKWLTYEELMDLALKNYNKGGDATYECWDEQTFNEYVDLFGPISKKKALEMFRMDKEIRDDIIGASGYDPVLEAEFEKECENFEPEEAWDEPEEAWDAPYIPSATAGDYGPSNPWDAPGMSIRDFI